MNIDEKGSPEELFELGKRFYLSTSGAADPVLALNYFRQAAEAGHVPAQRVLGACYLDGAGNQPDYAQALHWLTSAARQNDGQAAYMLAGMYVRGQGAPPNWRLAHQLLNMKSAAGLPETRRLKEEMKAELTAGCPQLVKRLAEFEKKRRQYYDQHRQRFILPWATPGRAAFEDEEFELWLKLASGLLRPEETLPELLALLNAYYDEQEKLHPAR